MAEEKNYKKTAEDIIRSVAHNYESLEKSVVKQLMLETPNHPYTTGTYREQVWEELFERMIPKKYCIEQGVFIMDSYGHISKEVDLVVFDEMYTPYIFRYGKIMFIPIEAVSVVIQCKSQVKSGGETENGIYEWLESIENLETSLDAVTRIVTGITDNFDLNDTKSICQTATRPIRILCARELKGKIKEKMAEKFDILLYANGDYLEKEINTTFKEYIDWIMELNQYEGKTTPQYNLRGEGYKKNKEIINKRKKGLKDDKKELITERTLEDLQIREKSEDGTTRENVILSLTFQLNQLLMLINNPMLFPHRAYAQLFQEVLGGGKENGDA